MAPKLPRLKVTCQIKEAVKKASVDVETALVGVSGGADSICLLHALAASGLKVVAIHLNHGWRGVESDADEAFVRDFCAILGVEFYSENLDEDCAKTETAARQARYEFFERALEKFDANVLFLAHNKNDNVETLVYRLIRGTGIEGLRSIPERRDKIVRPLLEIGRDEIEQYAADNNLAYREDASNSDTTHKRNFIRHKILPTFNEINPNYLNNIKNLIEVAQNECEIVERAIARAREEIFEYDSVSGERREKINTQKFLELNRSMKLKLIYNYLKEDLKFYDLERIKRIADFIEEHATEVQDPQYRTHKKFSINSKMFLYVNKKEIFKGE